ncbi:MAG: FMN-binding glutamate synthase family protein [Actinomycetota bacterium]
MIWLIGLAIIVAIVVVLGIIDLVQTRHAIRRNYPVVGRLRYALERIGPELRQYIVTDNDEERPFSRDQRRWVYASSKLENQYFGFGTDNKMDVPQYPIIRHSAFPYQPPATVVSVNGSYDAAAEGPAYRVPTIKVMGEWRNRRGAFRPASIVGISAMSFGSLSGPAIEALNRGSALAGCLHNTGEGGVSHHHRHGGDLILQLGTGYFGARTPDGRFDLDRAIALVERDPVRAIEIKLSQGAKPGLGGVLPGSKVTAEIAEARGVPIGQTVASPNRHVEFDSVSAMIDFVERVADGCGVPVGIKSAVGDRRFWIELADEMADTGRGPDFITIDGGEGGTGAAPLVFSDHVSLPFRSGFSEVYRVFAQRGMHDRVLWMGSGKLGFPGESLLAMTLGVDMISVGREAMLAVGCIQAQKCHTGHCPTGVATHRKWLVRGLDPTDKAGRVGNYVMNLRHELLQLAHACGKSHPSLVAGDSIDLLLEGETTVGLWEQYGYDPRWRTVSTDREAEVEALMV